MLFECSIAMQVKILFTTLTTAVEHLTVSTKAGMCVKYIWEKMIRLQARQNEKLEWNQTREIEQILMFEAEL